ncbi:MAG TPA: phosphoribosyltransferase family protein [Oscillospiraceae bacterium]|nr:phosphoribosyltransferase family protein [Oscillospiraceae bacterium]
MAEEFYTLQVAGLTRRLPICPVNEKLSIAAFVMFSDVELTVACATELVKKAPKCDVIITAESKGIPLAYEMARQLGITYVVARKMPKLYMRDPVGFEVQSITTAAKQMLYLDRNEVSMLEGKRVLIADDVISTGESLAAVEKLVAFANGNVVGKCAVLAEGDAADRTDIFFLEKLPLFFK